MYGANTIFIEKRSSCPSSLSRVGLPPLLDLSGRNCNVFLTKMDALRRFRTSIAACLNCHHNLIALHLLNIRNATSLIYDAYFESHVEDEFQIAHSSYSYVTRTLRQRRIAAFSQISPLKVTAHKVFTHAEELPRHIVGQIQRGGVS